MFRATRSGAPDKRLSKLCSRLEGCVHADADAANQNVDKNGISSAVLCLDVELELRPELFLRLRRKVVAEETDRHRRAALVRAHVVKRLEENGQVRVVPAVVAEEEAVARGHQFRHVAERLLKRGLIERDVDLRIGRCAVVKRD
uniref:Uncharacterized protein n=1 Tax=Chrysotila carterae TaxID=13221 RepID=A0A7S4B748_CHRCT